MNLINHEVVSAYNHFDLCKKVANLYQIREIVSEMDDEIFNKLYDEAKAAKAHVLDVIESTHLSQKKFQQEIDNMDLTQLGLDI